MDDNHTLCIFFSYHPSEPLPARTRELFEEGHNGRETGHPSKHAFVTRDATVPYADYWTRFTRENGYQFDYQSQVDTWFSGLAGTLGAGRGVSKSGIRPIFDRTKEHLGSSDTGIVDDPASPAGSGQRLSGPRDQAKRSNGTQIPSWYVRCRLTLPEATSWVDFGRPHMTARARRRFRLPTVAFISQGSAR